MTCKLQHANICRRLRLRYSPPDGALAELVETGTRVGKEMDKDVDTEEGAEVQVRPDDLTALLRALCDTSTYTAATVVHSCGETTSLSGTAEGEATAEAGA